MNLILLIRGTTFYFLSSYSLTEVFKTIFIYNYPSVGTYLLLLYSNY